MEQLPPTVHELLLEKDTEQHMASSTNYTVDHLPKKDIPSMPKKEYDHDDVEEPGSIAAHVDLTSANNTVNVFRLLSVV